MIFSRAVPLSRLRGLRLHRFVGSQLLVQAAGFVAGVLVVRAQSKGEYAIYAVVVAVQAAMTVLTDSGLSNAFLRTLSQADSDDGRAQLRASVIRVRRYLSAAINIVGLALVIPLLAVLGASLATIILVSVISVASLQVVIHLSIRQVQLRYEQRYTQLKNITLTAAILRVGLLGAMALTGFATVELLLLASLASSFVEYMLVARVTRKAWLVSERTNELYVKQFAGVLRATLPATLLSAAQYQGLYYVVGWRGGSTVVAELAAMSRFSVVFSVLNAVVSDVGVNFVARAGIRRARQLIIIALGLYAMAAVVIVGVGYASAGFLLGLLGDGYTQLAAEFAVVMTGSALINLTVAFRTLNQSAGRLGYAWVVAPVIALWFAVGIAGLDVSGIGAASAWMALQFAPMFISQLLALLKQGSVKGS